MQPALDEGLGGRLGLLPVALHDVGAAHEQLSHARLGVRLMQREIDDRHRKADRVGMLGRLLVGQKRRQRAGLGEAEAVAHARVGKGVLDRVHEALGDGRAAV